jgi:hypothetical protein
MRCRIKSNRNPSSLTAQKSKILPFFSHPSLLYPEQTQTATLLLQFGISSIKAISIRHHHQKGD